MKPLPSIIFLIACLAALALSSCSHLFNDAKFTLGTTYDQATQTWGVQVGKEPIAKAP